MTPANINPDDMVPADRPPEFVRGWWPSEAVALALLEASSNCERIDEDHWRIGGMSTNQGNAINCAQIRLALGYNDVTLILTSNMFAQLLRRITELES